MSWSRILLAPLMLGCLAMPAPAGIFSRNKPKTNPAERVPELLIQLRTERDEGKRTAAAEELRQHDPKAHPEIMTALADALAKDASANVRAEAAASLGKLRPATQQAGYALEQAVANDGSMRVRMAARQALWQYNLVGYRSSKPAEMPARPGEPTVSAPAGPSTPAAMARTSQRAATGPFRETAEPPLAEPQPAPAIVATPAPPPARVPAPAPLVPVKTSKGVPPPSAPASNRSAGKAGVPPAPPPPPAAKPPKPADAKAPPKSEGPELPF